MKKNNKREQTYNSMKEFEEKFFPKSFRLKSRKTSTNINNLGIDLAEKSLDIIRNSLSK
jgi:hypothetical protein